MNVFPPISHTMYSAYIMHPSHRHWPWIIRWKIIEHVWQKYFAIPALDCFQMSGFRHHQNTVIPFERVQGLRGDISHVNNKWCKNAAEGSTCMVHVTGGVLWWKCMPAAFGVQRRNNYRKTSSISRTKSQNWNVSCILLQLSSLNPLKLVVKLRMKM